MNGIRIRIGMVAAGVAILSAAGLQARQTVQPMATSDCEIAVGVEQVPIQAEPISVPVRFTEPLGDTIAATVPEDSKVKVLGVAYVEGDEPQTARITLNTSEAVAGEWAFTLRSGEKECKGVIRVKAAEGATK